MLEQLFTKEQIETLKEFPEEKEDILKGTSFAIKRQETYLDSIESKQELLLNDSIERRSLNFKKKQKLNKLRFDPTFSLKEKSENHRDLMALSACKPGIQNDKFFDKKKLNLKHLKTRHF